MNEIDTSKLLIESLINKHQYINSMEDILNFVSHKNSKTKVIIKKSTLSRCDKWYLSENGVIRNINNDFFSICGIKNTLKNNSQEQPIILQNEIGYLGIITKEINNNLFFLMQAKIEPGNINKIQISPTIQATRSNFTQAHGGKIPAYLDYFLNSHEYEIIVDQIQSEQSSRFLKKRNRNVIIKINEEIEVLDSHIWISLYQLKQLLKIDNLVNMDTRTVISCIPFHNIKFDLTDLRNVENQFLLNSFLGEINFQEVYSVYNKVNNLKMFDRAAYNLVSLRDLINWDINDNEIVSKTPFAFKVIFCDIEIEGREVTKWSQPLFEATGTAIFGLIYAKIDNSVKFLVKVKQEIGSFDVAELGPTIQREAFESDDGNSIETLFFDKFDKKKNIIYNVMLSEEGGRFYHEQNRNIIIEFDKEEVLHIPVEYMWLEYKTLSYLIQTNNIVNIQLRNLLSLMEVI